MIKLAFEIWEPADKKDTIEPQIIRQICMVQLIRIYYDWFRMIKAFNAQNWQSGLRG